MSTDDIDSENEQSLQDRQFKEIHGLLVSYKDDQINDCVKLALKRKTRVRYKCMDTFSNFLAFGTSGGAIYLFKLNSITHSSCSLISMIPCDQGSIEVIRFLPNPQTDDLLVAIGTKRGSLVIFKLHGQSVIANNIALGNDQQAGIVCEEFYRAEGFTNHNSIKLIEYDRDLFDPNYPFSKIYVSDSTNRLYLLDSTTIYTSKQSLRLFYTNHLPSLIFSVNDSEINQINVHRSQLLISTNETTRLFNEQTNQLHMIGTQKRRQGFYGACFFNPNYKPLRILQTNNKTRLANENQVSHTAYSSTASLIDLENLLIFVARPSFRLWQVNYERKVVLTHQFEPLIKNAANPNNHVIQLANEPIENEESKEDAKEIIEVFENTRIEQKLGVRSDHFQKLVPIYSSTLGNLLLSYTQQELFVVDPIGAKLIVWHSLASTNEQIVHICCCENELFLWTRAVNNDQPNYVGNMDHEEFRVERLVLLAPTQLVLELHRLHRHWTMISFVQLFSDLFRYRMALPLHGATSVITTEGGLLRNVLLNAWDMYEASLKRFTGIDQDDELDLEDLRDCQEFKRIVDQIVEESQQLKESLDNLTDSQFFLAMTSENIDRLCSEPYASLVSLEVSIADLHSNHVIHFNQNAMNRHRTYANLSRASITNINRFGQNGSTVSGAKSNFDLSTGNKNQVVLNNRHLIRRNPNNNNNNNNSVTYNNKVIVERMRPTKKIIKANDEQSSLDRVKLGAQIERSNRNFFSTRESKDEPRFNNILEEMISPPSLMNSLKQKPVQNLEDELERRRMVGRCNHCLWPYKRVHLKHLDSIQHIQLKWVENNLVDNFNENLEQIEQIAFKHGLWNMLLRCLVFKKDLDNYIICCMILNDVRLLDIEELIKQFGEDHLLDRIFLQLARKLQYSATKQAQTEEDSLPRQTCLKCEKLIQANDQKGYLNEFIQEGEEDEDDGDKCDEFSFDLVNIFDQFATRKEADVKKVVQQLSKHPNVLNNCKIPSSFYLKAISTLITNRTLSSRNKLEYRKQAKDVMKVIN